jgi:hypothetical protein
VTFDGLSGEAPADGGADAGAQDAAAADGTIALDGSSPQTTDANDEDGPAPPCMQSTTTFGFDGGLGPLSPFSTLSGYPNEESFFGDDALVLFPFRDTSPKDAGPDADPEAGPLPGDPEIKDKHSGLFYPTPVPLAAFDVSFDAKIVCTNNSSCADGLIFAWLDLQSSAALNTSASVYGSSAGLPDSVAGALFNIDDYKNDQMEQDDPYAPSLQIDILDKTKKVATYPWQQAMVHTSVIGDWHSYALSMRAGHVKVMVDGMQALDTTVPPLVSGIVGFTAGTGGASDAVAVRGFRGTFYACQP